MDRVSLTERGKNFLAILFLFIIPCIVIMILAMHGDV